MRVSLAQSRAQVYRKKPFRSRVPLVPPSTPRSMLTRRSTHRAESPFTRSLVRIVLASLGLFAVACGPPQASPPWDEMDQGFGDTERERAEEAEANRLALATLMERARQRAAETPAEDEPPRNLEVVVLEPPSTTWNDDGSLRSDAVDAFFLRGPHAILGALEFEVVHLDGRPLGYRVNRFAPHGRWIEDAGVATGDVITHVNGHQLIVPEAFLAAWETLPEVDAIAIRIWRDGTHVELAWPVRDPTP